MKKIFFLFAAVMSLLTVGCRDVLLEKNTGGFSVSFQTPGSSSRSGTTATWKLEAWLELESGTQLQKKDDTVLANAPITITFDAVPIGTKLKVQVRLEDSENSLIQHEGYSDWITVDAESKTVEVQVQRTIINAAAPSINTQPQSQTEAYQAGDEGSWMVTLTVAATSPDGGELSYQWYESSSDTTDGGEKLAEATKQSHEETLTPGETKYFYCVVTNTNDAVNGTKDATTTSNVAKLVYNIAQSGVLLWDSASVKIAPYGNYSADSSPVQVLDSVFPPVWCFDNTGNLYVLNEDYAGIRYDLKADGTYLSSTNYSNQYALTALSYDNVTGKLYGLGQNTPLLELTTAGSVDVIAGDVASEPLGLAVHNNIAYVAQVGLREGDNAEIKVSLAKYDVSQSPTLKSSDEMEHHQLPAAFGTEIINLTGQMVYHEGALYLLVGNVSYVSDETTANVKEVFSTGSLIKINPDTLDIDTSFGTNGFLGSDEPTEESVVNAAGPATINIYQPSSGDATNGFFGPQGIVGIMPKKLVIADSGRFTDASALTYKKKVRIVTVDLEAAALDVVDISDTDYYPKEISLSSFSEV